MNCRYLYLGKSFLPIYCQEYLQVNTMELLKALRNSTFHFRHYKVSSYSYEGCYFFCSNINGSTIQPPNSKHSSSQQPIIQNKLLLTKDLPLLYEYKQSHCWEYTTVHPVLKITVGQSSAGEHLLTDIFHFHKKEDW